MISVQEASNIIQSRIKDFGTEMVPLQQAVGRILVEDIRADRDFPPFTRITMDGIAIQYEAFANGQYSFPIQGIQAAGAPQQTLQNPQACLEAMTGGVLPNNADTIIRYEDVRIEDGVAHLVEGLKIRKGQNAHSQGFDRKTGDVIIKAGRQLSPAEVGVAATVGMAYLKVKRLPTVAIISTGDELVGIEDTPAPHQIRSSNVFAIQSVLAKWGITADPHHIVDDLVHTQKRLGDLLEKYDALLLSGGVSKGKFDYVPAALEALNVKKYFHRISQRPGKPFWFGEAPDGTMVFALPGNPVSSFMCNLRYFQPWLRESLGLTPSQAIYAQLTADFTFKPDLTYFLQVKTHYDPSTGKLMATPVPGKGSGDLANLADADAFLELPSGRDLFKEGEVYSLIFYR